MEICCILSLSFVQFPLNLLLFQEPLCFIGLAILLICLWLLFWCNQYYTVWLPCVHTVKKLHVCTVCAECTVLPMYLLKSFRTPLKGLCIPHHCLLLFGCNYCCWIRCRIEVLVIILYCALYYVTHVPRKRIGRRQKTLSDQSVCFFTASFQFMSSDTQWHDIRTVITWSHTRIRWMPMAAGHCH